MLLDLLEMLVELVHRRDPARAQFVYETAQLIVEIGKVKDLVRHPEQRLELPEHRENDAVALDRIVADGIEFAGKVPVSRSS